MIATLAPFARRWRRLGLQHMTAPTSENTRNRFARVAALALAGLLSATASMSAFAQGRVSVVRDAEIEALVRDYARPILKAAGLSSSGIEIVLVNDPSFNAFVDGRRIFVNTGALMTAETPNEIIGVIAHEAGHLAGGHQQRLREQLKRAQTMALVGTLLGIGVGAEAPPPRTANSHNPAWASQLAAVSLHGAACLVTSALKRQLPTSQP